MNKESISNIKRGIIKENPVFVMMIGMCPTLGVTTSAINGLGMGVATLFVLILSNVVISSVAKFIPNTIRIPCYIVIIASFVSLIDMLMEAYLPTLHSQLGIYIPLIVVNCLILARAEAFASKNTVLQSFFDGLGMGIGFTLALLLLGSFREILGNASIFGWNFLGEDVYPMILFILPPGAFLALGLFVLLTQKRKGDN